MNRPQLNLALDSYRYSVERIAVTGDREFWLASLRDTAEFRNPFAGEPFPCLLWASADQFADEERARLANALIAANCRYAVCGGIESEKWHDAIDFAAIRVERFLMTTWHDDEDEDEVVWFFVMNTNYEDFDFRRYLILDLAGNAGHASVLAAAVRRHARIAPAV